MIPKIPKYNKTVSPESFFAKIFNMRDVVHLTHLKQLSKNGWEHKALNEFYDEILDLIDDIVESYQGVYGIIDITIPEAKASTDILYFLTDMYNCVESDRYIFKESWIQSEIDLISKALAKTIYKLKHVK